MLEPSDYVFMRLFGPAESLPSAEQHLFRDVAHRTGLVRCIIARPAPARTARAANGPRKTARRPPRSRRATQRSATVQMRRAPDPKALRHGGGASSGRGQGGGEVVAGGLLRNGVGGREAAHDVPPGPASKVRILQDTHGKQMDNSISFTASAPAPNAILSVTSGCSVPYRERHTGGDAAKICRLVEDVEFTTRWRVEHRRSFSE